ncbi:MAG: hypothetical protein WDM86_06690 [Rhizomicrobium sp.]
MTAPARRLVAAIVLVAFGCSLGLALFFGPNGIGLYLLYQLRWPLIVLAAMIAATIWQRRQHPRPPAPKPRPTHLKIVKSDETRH